jgi:hypothetical protein
LQAAAIPLEQVIAVIVWQSLTDPLLQTIYVFWRHRRFPIAISDDNSCLAATNKRYARVSASLISLQIASNR